jgi:hypothetical protein
MKIKIGLWLNFQKIETAAIRDEILYYFFDWTCPVLPRKGEQFNWVNKNLLPEEVKEKLSNVKAKDVYEKLCGWGEDATLFEVFSDEPLVVMSVEWVWEDGSGYIPLLHITYSKNSGFYYDWDKKQLTLNILTT